MAGGTAHGAGSAPPWRRRVGLALGAASVTLIGWAAPGAAATAAPRWPAQVTWRDDVPAPRTADVSPVAVVATTGAVRGASTLVDGSGGAAVTLTDRRGAAAPSLVVDYGQDVGGVPYVVVHSATGSPTLRLAFSEGRQYLGPDGDDAPSASNAGDAARADDLLVAAPGRTTTGLIQGGERFERVSLITPGSVTLSGLGIDFTAVRATAADYRGWFASSSPELDRIWYDGAYTAQLDQIPADSVPAAWRSTGGALEAVQGQAGLLDRGTGWSDYTMTFDTRVVDNSAGWVVRAADPSSGYLLFIRAPAAGPGSRATLAEVAVGPDEFSEIGTAPLPAGFDVARWHRVSTVVSGSTVTTSIDGRRVAAFDLAALRPGTSVYDTGTVGFDAIGSIALYRDLDVTGPGGTTLYADTLSSPTALGDFPGPNVTSSDPIPAVVDGAKRDRVVWSGDLGTEGPTIFDSTDDASFVRGSLQILGSNQVADGETGTNVDPTAPLGTFPAAGTPYSTAYSMDTVDDLGTYYLYTGDLAFVRSEWPMVTRELNYDHSLLDTHGLVVTDGSDGQDWDYYDGARSGEVTATNVIYFQTLNDAATMAQALGLPSQAATYRSEAAAVRTAVNRYLLDPASGLYGLSNLEPTVVPQDANALAVVDGVAPGAQSAALLSRLTSALPQTPYGPDAFSANSGYRTQVSPFVTSDEVRALFETDQTSAALTLLTRLWGHMDAPGPDDSRADWELVGADGRPGFGAETSLAHGWSSGATADLTGEVLGVTPATAGYQTWTVQPHPGPLSWAEGDVPTPAGPVTVRWAQRTATGAFALEVDAPSGTRGTIAVPVPATGAVVTARATRDGRAVGPPTVTRSVPGVRFQAVPATGGLRYDVTVMPAASVRG